MKHLLWFLPLMVVALYAVEVFLDWARRKDGSNG